MKFEELGLHQGFLEQIHDMGFIELTQVQENAIPAVLDGKDLTILSQTGSGKTFSFLVPFIELMIRENWAQDKIDKIALLVVVPTRELAIQIAEEANKLLEGSELSADAFYGGSDIDKQIRQIQKGVAITIFTPGRLIDLLGRQCYDFASIPYLVIDEADRLFDMGFVDDIRFIIGKLKGLKQRIMSSATLSNEVLSLADFYLQDPMRIEINPEEMTVDLIDQLVFHLGAEEKKRFMVNYLRSLDTNLVMVFANTKDMVEDLAELLSKNGFKAKGISSRLTQNTRTKLIKEFREEGFFILIATDLASRGLDIDGVTHVINYDLPDNPENYVHRVGRTARAGKTGEAISFCSERDYQMIHRIEDFIGQKIEVGVLEDKYLTDVVMPPSKRYGRNRDFDRRSTRNNTRGERRDERDKPGSKAGNRSRGDNRSRSNNKPENSSFAEANRKKNTGNTRRDNFRDNSNRGNQRDNTRKDRSRSNYNDSYNVAQSVPEEPMVTVYKRGSYIDPVEAQKELLRITEQEESGKTKGLWQNIKSIFKGKKKASDEAKSQDRAGRRNNSANSAKDQKKDTASSSKSSSANSGKDAAQRRRPNTSRQNAGKKQHSDFKKSTGKNSSKNSSKKSNQRKGPSSGNKNTGSGNRRKNVPTKKQ